MLAVSNGGDGGELSTFTQANGGSPFGDPEQAFLYGGSAGGRGREVGCDSDRGDGGGAIQLSVFDVLTVESGAVIHANANANANANGGRSCSIAP